MKRFLLSIIALVCICSVASAQGRVSTKKFRIKDFREKVTKIVIPKSDIRHSVLSQEVLDRWHISAFELCSADEFESLKTSADYYFLLYTEGLDKYGRSDGITYLSLVKGGPEATKGIGSMTKVVSLPVSATGTMSSGRELAFIGVFVDIIQEYTLRAIESEIDAYSGLCIFNRIHMKNDGWRKQLHISEDDMSSRFTAQTRSKYGNDGFCIEPEDDVDKLITTSTHNVLVSYVVAPAVFSVKSKVYKMLIEPGTCQLYYYRSETIKTAENYGFTEKDFKRILKLRKK